jgi:hypothetical protein
MSVRMSDAMHRAPAIITKNIVKSMGFDRMVAKFSAIPSISAC